MEKTILITGSTKGIGFETARQLLNLGHHVIVSGRDGTKLSRAVEQLSGFGKITKLQMDVITNSGIEKACEQLTRAGIVPDVIINNAGILVPGDHSLSVSSEELFHEILLTNAYGPLRVVRAFLPHLKPGSRIINISSGGGSMSDPVGGWSPAYCTSKTLLNAITRQLAFELNEKSIQVNAVCPGWVKTDMGGKSAPRPVEKGAETPVWLATEEGLNETGKFFRDKREIPW